MKNFEHEETARTEKTPVMRRSPLLPLFPPVKIRFSIR